MVGRGTRLCEGKDHLLILDFLWLTSRHELCRPTCLICKKEDVAKVIDEKMAESGEVFSIDEETIDKVMDDVRAQREAALARQLKEQRAKKAKLVDPLQFEMSIADDDLLEYEPTFAWEFESATENQLKALERFGINTGDEMLKGYASMLLDRLIKRASSGMTTPKQIRTLERYGFQDVGTWAFEDAKAIISYLAMHNWCLPYNVDPVTYVPKSKRS